MAQRKKTPVVACGICGENGHTSSGHEYQNRGIYSGVRPKKNILGKRRKKK